MNPLDRVFQQLREQGRRAFIPFLTAGDPDLAATAQLMTALATGGADLIEVGFPYSDPIADGPVIQASYTRALNRGLHVDEIFDCLGRLSSVPPFANGFPLVGMVSYALIHRRGLHDFLDTAKSSGLCGLVVPDLPVEEAGELAALAAARDIKLIQLVTPTTPRDRALRIAQLSTGFLYCVSVTGITGMREALPSTLLEQLRWLRGQTQLPLCVGFGISKPEHVQLLREVADGVIVGSALVKLLEQVPSRGLETVAAELTSLVRTLAAALNPS